MLITLGRLPYAVCLCLQQEMKMTLHYYYTVYACTASPTTLPPILLLANAVTATLLLAS